MPHADLSPALKARDSKGPSSDGDGDGDGAILVPMVSHALRSEGFDASEDGTGRGTPLVPAYTLAIRGRGDSHDLEFRTDGTANALLTPNGGRAGIGVGAIAFDARQSDVTQYGNMTWTLDTNGHTIGVLQGKSAQPSMHVRRLTPKECARLQGFPDDYLDIKFHGKPATDSVKYKALGNSMAVNCMRWIGTRIQMVNALERARAAA